MNTIYYSSASYSGEVSEQVIPMGSKTWETPEGIIFITPEGVRQEVYYSKKAALQAGIRDLVRASKILEKVKKGFIKMADKET